MSYHAHGGELGGGQLPCPAEPSKPPKVDIRRDLASSRQILMPPPHVGVAEQTPILVPPPSRFSVLGHARFQCGILKGPALEISGSEPKWEWARRDSYPFQTV